MTILDDFALVGICLVESDIKWKKGQENISSSTLGWRAGQHPQIMQILALNGVNGVDTDITFTHLAPWRAGDLRSNMGLNYISGKIWLIAVQGYRAHTRPPFMLRSAQNKDLVTCCDNVVIMLANLTSDSNNPKQWQKNKPPSVDRGILHAINLGEGLRNSSFFKPFIATAS